MRINLAITVIVVVIFGLGSCKKASNDDSKPWIELQGYNPVYSELGVPYQDAGAIVWDINEAGDTVDISGSLKTEENVNANVAGKYYVKYNAQDDAGNNADEVTRTVYIQVFKQKN